MHTEKIPPHIWRPFVAGLALAAGHWTGTVLPRFVAGLYDQFSRKQASPVDEEDIFTSE